MKLKHWQGYGSITAKKLSKRRVKDEWGEKNNIELKIRVEGNHEWGLDVYRGWDTYGVYNWLVKRFAKDCPSDSNIISVTTSTTYEEIQDVDTEVCVYTIIYKA